MTLPRPILHRIRRCFRRRLMITDRSTLRRIEEWTGHRPPPPPTPPDPMKLPRLLLLLAAALLALFLTGCEGLTVSVTPDGQIVAGYTYTPPKAPVVDDKGTK